MNIIDLSKSKTQGPMRAGPVELDPKLTQIVFDVLSNVKESGRKACVEYTQKFDGLSLRESELLQNPAELSKEEPLTGPGLRAIRHAMENVWAYHERQQKEGFDLRSDSDCLLGERWIPLDRVGCYVPGGSAPLVSTLLMTVIPAKIAGVDEIIVATPPDGTGALHPAMLAVCEILEVETVLLQGGAQAIGALAYGFENFSPVQKIVGPGNKYVTEAKRQVYGIVDIDMLAGPSEVCIVADRSAPPAYVAADLLSQLEHDADAKGIVIAWEKSLLTDVQHELEGQMQDLPRKDVVKEALDNLEFYLVKNQEDAFALTDSLAPEHLEVMVEDAVKYADRKWKSGAVFLGQFTPVAVGDFYGGTNHVLPTAGRAAFSSPLGVTDFCRRIQHIYYSKRQLQAVHKDIMTLASMEALEAHRRSVGIRADDV